MKKYQMLGPLSKVPKLVKVSEFDVGIIGIHIIIVGILSLLTDKRKESANRMKKKRVDSESHSFMVESGPSKMIDIAGPSPKHRKMKKLHGGSADSRELKVNNDKASGSTHRSTDTRNPMRRAVNRKSMEDIRNWFTSASKNHSQASYADTGRNSIVGENSAVSSKIDKDGTSLWNETVEALSTEMIFKPQPRRLSPYVNVKKLRHSGIVQNDFELYLTIFLRLQ